jgi:cytochrome c oxidase assembly factor CtaG
LDPDPALTDSLRFACVLIALLIGAAVINGSKLVRDRAQSNTPAWKLVTVVLCVAALLLGVVTPFALHSLDFAARHALLTRYAYAAYASLEAAKYARDRWQQV